jgi:hypothetical protein
MPEQGTQRGGPQSWPGCVPPARRGQSDSAALLTTGVTGGHAFGSLRSQPGAAAAPQRLQCG